MHHEISTMINEHERRTFSHLILRQVHDLHFICLSTMSHHNFSFLWHHWFFVLQLLSLSDVIHDAFCVICSFGCQFRFYHEFSERNTYLREDTSNWSYHSTCWHSPLQSCAPVVSYSAIGCIYQLSPGSEQSCPAIKSAPTVIFHVPPWLNETLCFPLRGES